MLSDNEFSETCVADVAIVAEKSLTAGHIRYPVHISVTGVISGAARP